MCLVAVVTKLCMVVHNIGGSSVQSLLHVTLLAEWLLEFWEDGAFCGHRNNLASNIVCVCVGVFFFLCGGEGVGGGKTSHGYKEL